MFLYQRDISCNRCGEKGSNIHPPFGKAHKHRQIWAGLLVAFLWYFAVFVVMQVSSSLHHSHRGIHTDAQIVFDFSSL